VLAFNQRISIKQSLQWQMFRQYFIENTHLLLSLTFCHVQWRINVSTLAANTGGSWDTFGTETTR